MPPLNRPAQEFLRAYAPQFADTDRAAKLVGAEVERVVRDTGAFVHAVTARAKAVDSLRGKLRRRRYKRPAQRITDIIGVRVITYYRDAVDPIVTRLWGFLEVSRPQGRNWREAVSEGVPFYPGLDVSCVEALKAVGLGTAAS